MTFSGYFMSKSVFGQRGCRAFTFALAKLSWFKSQTSLHCKAIRRHI